MQQLLLLLGRMLPTCGCKEKKMSKYIDAVGQAYKEIQEKKLDPVDKDELKGKHKDRKDKDIDNDGDVDSTDKYLHKRRKAITKNSKDKEGDVTMNPNLDKETQKEDVDKAVEILKKKTKDTNWHNKDGKVNHPYYDGKNIKRHMDRHGVKAPHSTHTMAPENKVEESRIRAALKSVLAEKSHTAGATEPETMDDKLKGKGAKDMVNQPKEVEDVKKGHDDASKAGRVTKPAAGRNGGDQVRSGDQKVVNAIAAAYKGMKNGN